MKQNKKWFAVVNPASANGRTGKMWQAFRQKLISEGYFVDYALTTKQWDAVLITKTALEHGEQRIIAVGGDGTLNEVINGFLSVDQAIRDNAELAILTHGTGSDFIRTIGVERGINSFLKVLQRSDVTKVDIGKAEYLNALGLTETRYFLNVADVGLGAEIARKVNRTSKILGGKISFLLASVRVILTYRNKMIHCIINEENVVEGRLNSVMVANGRYFGGGMMIAPLADLRDGEFDIVTLGDFSPFQLLRHLPKIYQGRHLEVPGVKLYRGQRVVVQSKDKVMFEVDGEQAGIVPVQFTILPQAIWLWR